MMVTITNNSTKHYEKMENIRELTFNEYLEINGGEPTTKTSFFYDFGWWIGRGIREVESWFE